jgi:hypothetical protein
MTRSSRWAWAAIGAWLTCAPIAAQLPRPVGVEPLGPSGEAIFPAFEGWGPTKNGDTVLLLGYFNRNRGQELDIPIGPDNRIEPGGPDYGQPTHFYTSRQHGVFAIRIPKDFGNQRLTWTLTANGHTSTVAFWTNPPYWIDFFRNSANGNEPPVIRFARDGATMSGPPVGLALTVSGAVGQPVPLSLWASDVPIASNEAEDALAARARTARPRTADPVAVIGTQVIGGGGGGAATRTAPADITVSWRKHRAPAGADVRFAHDRIPVVTKGDAKLFVEAQTTATFTAPGEYVIRAQVNDQSGDGGGGDQCCWTTAHVRVNVK